MHIGKSVTLEMTLPETFVPFSLAGRRVCVDARVTDIWGLQAPSGKVGCWMAGAGSGGARMGSKDDRLIDIQMRE